MSCNSINVCNIHFNYLNTPIFNDFSISFSEKKWTSVLGPSGVGKSTLLRIVAGLTNITSGKVLPKLQNRISYLGQNDTLLPWLTALENVLLPYELQNFKNKSIREQAKKLFSEFYLSNAIGKYPHQLSGGMKQRVRIIRTLLEDKPIILMDEPFSSLDVITRFELQNLAAHYFRDKTVISVTHDPLEALRLSQQIIILSGNPALIQTSINLSSDTPRNINHKDVLLWQEEIFENLAYARGDIA